MITAEARDSRLINLHRRVERPAIADDDPVPANAGMAPHRRPHRVGRGDSPGWQPTKARLLFTAQRRCHRGIGEDMHQTLLEETETLGMAIDRHHDPAGGDGRLRCCHLPVLALTAECGCRACLED